jgi:hypothetical protein
MDEGPRPEAGAGKDMSMTTRRKMESWIWAMLFIILAFAQCNANSDPTPPSTGNALADLFVVLWKQSPTLLLAVVLGWMAMDMRRGFMAQLKEKDAKISELHALVAKLYSENTALIKADMRVMGEVAAASNRVAEKIGETQRIKIRDSDKEQAG